MADNGQDKTEAPTAKRRKDAAEKGDVLQSKELGTALVVLSGAVWAAMAGPWMVRSCEKVIQQGLTFDHGVVEGFNPGGAIISLMVPVALPLATLLAMTLVAAVGTPAMLGSLGFRWGAIGFKGAKLNPINGIQCMFGLQGLTELGKAILKVSVLGVVAYWLLKSRMPDLLGTGRGDPRATYAAIGQSFTFAFLVMASGLVAIAGADIPMQLIQRARRLRMSKQEIKDEHKQTEGNPEAKGAQKSKRREMLSKSARKAVKEATVVLTNPTHFAVALRYRPGFDAAPIVVAKGRDETARAIRELADADAVPILSYPQLTRAIYFTSRAGQLVREDLYIAVATILAFVFNLDRAMAEGIVQPKIDVPPDAHFDEQGRATAS
ncbi:flagellar biosynthetic protein FlhB [Sphingomonas vulcanisoli]|uniref:Flagellar biosynthetic protein FlhB n=1 Tax=Sphingomonas vulcanisoli TaxID=1658060 RepID=A0ABX0TZE4_9SPHN|nr:flagellar type III secretion system protein FlhB [Sphingomonas vulcanisoli]NIJ09589.1 flagellar biosynthetic protein FlhB [Sphingomonas vulcanisoli]